MPSISDFHTFFTDNALPPSPLLCSEGMCCDITASYCINKGNHSKCLGLQSEKTFRYKKCTKNFWKLDHLKTWEDSQKKRYSNVSIIRRHSLKQLEETRKDPHRRETFQMPQVWESFSIAGHLKEHEETYGHGREAIQEDKVWQELHQVTRKPMRGSGEIPFKCTQCDMIFSTSSYLETHKTIQEGSHSSAQRVIRVLQDQVQGAWGSLSNVQRVTRASQ